MLGDAVAHLCEELNKTEITYPSTISASFTNCQPIKFLKIGKSEVRRVISLGVRALLWIVETVPGRAGPEILAEHGKTA